MGSNLAAWPAGLVRVHRTAFGLAAVCVLSLLLVSGCDRDQSRDGSGGTQAVSEPVVVRGTTMGTFYTITVPGGYAGGAEALKGVAEEQFARISAAISTFDARAEIYRFNERHSTEPFPISVDLATVISEARHQSKRLDGAMDISVGPLVELWGFGRSGRKDSEPSEKAIAEAKRLVGLDSYELRYTSNEPLLIKHYPDMRLDLATVGEGVGADWVAEALDRRGVTDYLVSVAGASRSRGHNPRGGLWKIGIEDPTSQEHKVFTVICPLDQAVSTAGSYRNFFQDPESGKFYSHIIDPATGRPVEHSTLSVTVADRSALVTDALDTGLLVWGADRALAWADRHDIAIYTIEMQDGRPVGRHSRAFAKYLRCGAPAEAEANRQQ